MLGVAFMGQAILTEIIKYILTADDITTAPPLVGSIFVNPAVARNVSVSADSRNKTVLTKSLNSVVLEQSQNTSNVIEFNKAA